MPESNVVLSHQKSANQLWIKIVLIALILASGISFGLYALASREESISAAEQSQIDTIAILKASYDSCMNKASNQLDSYDPNDLFMTRQIDATKSRCESLRNEYNHAIDEYDKLYSN